MNASKSSKSWVELKAVIPVEAVEAVADFLFELGANGIVFEDEDTLPLEKSTAKIPKDKIVLRAYYPKNEKQLKKLKNADEFLKTITPIFPRLSGAKTVRKFFRETNWAAGWRKFFKATMVTDTILVKPYWEKRKCRDNEICIDINPGLAFGTGSHPTTRMCLRYLENAIEERMSQPEQMLTPPSFLDVGCGSGILAIAAAKLGAGRVVAVDVDERAVAAALENIRLNELAEEIEVIKGSVDAVAGTFDIIACNIFSEELLAMRSELVKRLAPDGILILSGILKTAGAEVKRAFIREALDFRDVLHDEDWCCLVFVKI